MPTRDKTRICDVVKPSTETSNSTGSTLPQSANQEAQTVTGKMGGQGLFCEYQLPYFGPMTQRELDHFVAHMDHPLRPGARSYAKRPIDEKTGIPIAPSIYQGD